MVGTSHRNREATVDADATARALVVADVNWYTTEHLFREVRRPGVSTLLLKCSDYVNAWHRGELPWSWGAALAERGPRLWQRELVLPSGWMKRFPRLGMRPIRRAITGWRAQHATGGPLTLVMTYPHYLYLRDQVRPDVLVYFNIDDYTQYWPRCADRVNALEIQAVRESDLTVCVSNRRCEALREAVPGAADRIRHLPHGAPRPALGPSACAVPAPAPPDLAGLPRPLLGYVGTLEDRVDWALLDAVARRFANGTVVLLGRPDPDSRGAWTADRSRCLSRPNVKRLGWRPQDELGAYNRAFDVCLIPYRADHPFNRVCCPTKIMDYMGSGRPIVSTDLPECRLYERLFDVVGTPEAFLDRVAAIVADGSDDGRAEARFAWAREHTCERVAERLLGWLPG
jgi:glycosyltransferase involved in cell wall biosynthesis